MELLGLFRASAPFYQPKRLLTKLQCLRFETIERSVFCIMSQKRDDLLGQGVLVFATFAFKLACTERYINYTGQQF